jgi:hypothetical protein
MPFKEATFWFGITVFGTGLFGWMEGGSRMGYAIALAVIGLLITVYSVVAHHQPNMPKLPVWIGLLFITWGALGYDFYDRHHSPFSSDLNLQRVHDRTFENEEVPLDGFDYEYCTFKHVTLKYNGTAPFSMGNNTFSGPPTVKTDNPAVQFAWAIDIALGMMPPGTYMLGGPDKQRLHVEPPTATK